VLEYTRRSLVKLVRELKVEGIDLQDVLEKGLGDMDVFTGYMVIQTIFDTAFCVNHPNVSRETKDTLFGKFANKDALAEKLFEICAFPVNTLADEEEQGEISWTAGE
jgi:hypothetical protein